MWYKSPPFKLGNCVGCGHANQSCDPQFKDAGRYGASGRAERAYAALRIAGRDYVMEIWDPHTGYTHQGSQKHHRVRLSPHNAIDRRIALYTSKRRIENDNAWPGKGSLTPGAE